MKVLITPSASWGSDVRLDFICREQRDPKVPRVKRSQYGQVFAIYSGRNVARWHDSPEGRHILGIQEGTGDAVGPQSPAAKKTTSIQLV